METTRRWHELALTDLYPTLRALGLAGADEELARHIRQEGGGARAVAALRGEFFSAVSAQVPTTYPVTVDYGMTLEQMIAAGRYDTRNDNIAEKNFPVTGTGQVEVELHLVHLGWDASTDTVLAELENHNLRPATLPELLALGAKYPDLQKQFPLVALGSVWQPWDGNRRVAFLDDWRGRRDLDLLWVDGDWLGRCRFLAVSK